RHGRPRTAQRLDLTLELPDPGAGGREAIVIGVAGSGDLGVVVEAGRYLGLEFGEFRGRGRGGVDAGLFELASQPGPALGDGSAFGLGGGDALLEVLGLRTAELERRTSGQVVFVDRGVIVAPRPVGGDLEFDDLPGQSRKIRPEDA